MSLPPPAEPASRAAFLGLNPWLQRFLTIIAGAVVAVIAWTVIARFLHILVLLLASFLVAFLPGPLVDRLGARGFLRRDGHRIPFYQYMGAATERTGNRRCRPPAAPTTDKRQAQFLTALIHQTQVVRGSWVWLHWCGVEELCQARGGDQPRSPTWRRRLLGRWRSAPWSAATRHRAKCAFALPIRGCGRLRCPSAHSETGTRYEQPASPAL